MLSTLTWPGLGALLLIACMAGAVSISLGGREPGGFVAAALIGLVGAIVGPWLAGVLQIAELVNLRVGDQPFPLISSAVGAAGAVTLLHLTLASRRLRS